MKKVKQMLAAAMALVMALSLAACTASPFKNPIATLGDAVVPSEEFYYYYSSLVSSFEDQRQAAFSTFSDEKMDRGKRDLLRGSGQLCAGFGGDAGRHQRAV